jgi:hypothetical protein
MLTFSLLALLLYPDGHYLSLDLGDRLSNEQCVAGELRVETQLKDDLSVAQLMAVKCKKRVEL